MFANLNPGTVGIADTGTNFLVPLAARAGFGGMDLPRDALASDAQAEHAAQLFSEHGLRVGLFGLPTDFLRGSDAVFADGLARLRETAPRARLAGCRRAYNHIWPGSNDRAFEANWTWHVERVERLAEVLTVNDIQLGLEFIGPQTLRDSFAHSFVYKLEQAIELADAVGSHVGIVVDCFHWYCSGGTLDDLRAVSGARIVNVHANDALTHRTREQQQDLERALPLENGIIDAAAVLRVLRENGYDGPVIAEPFNPTRARFQSLPPETVVHEVSQCLQRLFTASK